MNLDELQRKLVAAARADAPSDRVPLAFEKRILARVAALPGADAWAFWARAMWRATAPCLAIMVLLGAWSLFTASDGSSGSDLSQDFENTVLATADQDSSTDSLW
jgi:hypothetical protein